MTPKIEEVREAIGELRKVTEGQFAHESSYMRALDYLIDLAEAYVEGKIITVGDNFEKEVKDNIYMVKGGRLDPEVAIINIKALLTKFHANKKLVESCNCHIIRDSAVRRVEEQQKMLDVAVEALEYSLEELNTLKEYIPMHRDKRYLIQQALDKIGNDGEVNE